MMGGVASQLARLAAVAVALTLAACAAGPNRFAGASAGAKSTTPAEAPTAESAGVSTTTTRTATTIKIDGSLADEGWQGAITRRGFWQREPDEGESATFDTEFRIVYDDAAIYVAVRAHDPNPEQIVARLTRRDEGSSADWIYVAFDSYHDRRTAFMFGVNAAGVQRDILKFNDTNEDPGWNAVWDSAVKIDDKGWVAEFRIPLSQLRYSGDAAQRWGLQVSRFVQRTNELSLWSPQPRDSGRDVSLYGELSGLDDLERRRRFELLPYGSIGVTRADVSDADILNNDNEGISGVGLDFKYGLTSNFTLSGALNPDFGQVEADPSQVNLSANEVFFAEKRPFFLEGTDLFQARLRTGGGPDALFYSRRIGAAPHDSGDGYADFFDEPRATTILGAAKITGKTSGGWSLGVLETVTAEEKSYLADVSGERSERVIEPLTNYAVVRAKKEWRAGQTSAAGVATGVHRALDGTDLSWLHSQAYSGGLEFIHRFGGGNWSTHAILYGSHVRGDPVAIDETQRGPQRYFQRPDADHIDYDPTRDSLSGLNAAFDIGKWNGGNFRFGTGGDTITPGFSVNDLGFQQRADQTRWWAWGQYWDADVGDIFRMFRAEASVFSLWNHAGQQLVRGMDSNINVTLLNYWNLWIGGNLNDNRLNSGALRGGPALAAEPSVSMFGGFLTDGRKDFVVNISGSGWYAPTTGARGWDFNPTLSWQARSNLKLIAGPTLGVARDETQYVSEVVGADGESHYVMSQLDRVTTSLTLRANYTLSPKFSLQLYAQPFIATGRYSDYKEVVDPRAGYDNRYRFYADNETRIAGDSVELDRDGDGAADLTFDQLDFSFGQLRSTFVARWEYLPGSTLFLIWSHSRTSFVEDGRFQFGDDVGDLARSPGEHVLLAKLNYWIGG